MSTAAEIIPDDHRKLIDAGFGYLGFSKVHFDRVWTLPVPDGEKPGIQKLYTIGEARYIACRMRAGTWTAEARMKQAIRAVRGVIGRPNTWNPFKLLQRIRDIDTALREVEDLFWEKSSEGESE